MVAMAGKAIARSAKRMIFQLCIIIIIIIIVGISYQRHLHEER
jgi:hypothetical protein